MQHQSLTRFRRSGLRSLRVVLATAALAACVLGASWWHDQALYSDEDEGWIAESECELRWLLPGNFKLIWERDADRPTAGTWKSPVPTLPAHQFAFVYEGDYRDDNGATSRRVCRAVMIHDGYLRWILHSLQIEGEPERIVDEIRDCDMHDERWLGLGGP